jgi:ribonuclease HI
MEQIVYIHADESCLGNQYKDRDSPGGAGGLVEVWKGGAWQRRDYWLSEPATTNNRMAIRSAIAGLEGLTRPCSVIFTSDSQYLVRGMREWIQGWARRGWKRRTGAIENEQLWRALAAAARRHSVDWRWVRGHAGHPRNEYANALAIRAAKEQTSSDGFAPSGFESWLEDQRERYERYFDFMEFAPPSQEVFRPAAVPG